MTCTSSPGINIFWTVQNIEEVAQSIKRLNSKNKVLSVDTCSTTQGYSESTSSIAFEVPIINCQTCFKDFQLKLLDVKFCFPKRYISHRQKRAAIMDACPYFRLLNSNEKMMTSWKHNHKSFEVLHTMHKYTKMRIPGKSHLNYTVHTL